MTEDTEWTTSDPVISPEALSIVIIIESLQLFSVLLSNHGMIGFVLSGGGVQFNEVSYSAGYDYTYFSGLNNLSCLNRFWVL